MSLFDADAYLFMLITPLIPPLTPFIYASSSPPFIFIAITLMLILFLLRH